MKTKIITSVFLLLLCWQSANSQSVITDLKPKKDTVKVCENPWKGWYQHYYDANFSSYVPGSDSEMDNFPGMDHIYIRLSWAYFEPAEGQYDWKIIDDVIARWGPKGYKIAFRITAYDPYVLTYATPEWVKNAGAKGEFINIQWETKQYWEPDYNDPIFLAKWNNFQKAMAAKYDGNPIISYVDISHATWGEGHHSFGDNQKSDLATLKKSVDIFTNNFVKTPLVVS